MAKERNTFSRSRLFKPKYVRRLTTESTPTKIQNAGALSGSSILTSSFRYDPPGTGFKSTQQIPVDWSRFENHTFFDSAESKVNVSYDNIINNFPFDGTKQELETFFDDLSGYEKYVYDKFPKRTGYLYFSGTHNENVAAGPDVTPYIASGNAVANVASKASLDNAINCDTAESNDKIDITVPVNIGGTGSAIKVIFMNTIDGTEAAGQIAVKIGASDDDTAASLIKAINGVTDATVSYGGQGASSSVTVATTTGLLASEGSTGNTWVKIEPALAGDEGNVAVLERDTGFAGALMVITAMTGGRDSGINSVTGKNLGTWLQVNDHAGSLFPSISKTRSGKSVISPGTGDISFEFHLNTPAQKNDDQIILQKLSGSTKGITLFLTRSHLDSTCGLTMMASSEVGFISANMDFPKGEFNHVYASLNKEKGYNSISLFLNGDLVSSSSAGYDLGEIDFKGSPLIIGSGSSHEGKHAFGLDDTTFTPKVTLSGSMDELRVWHKIHSTKQIKESMRREVYASSDLKLYYKFNEPITGSKVSTVDDIILDSSGLSMHGRVENFTTCAGANSDLHRGPIYDDNTSELISGSAVSPMTLESIGNHPILFPDNGSVEALNIELLNSASEYDSNNPNLITKLIPKHYLLEASVEEGYTDELGDTFNKYGNTSDYALPGLGDIPSPQIISMMLFTWAKYFDEIKIFVDHFSNLLWVDYDTNDVIAEQFIPFLADYYGFESLPNMFSGASLDQLLKGENLLVDPSISASGLQYIQNQLWKRVLINFNDIIRSKGTIHGIKALLRAVGIRPNSLFRFREYGGSSTRELRDIRKSRTEISTLLDFSGSNADVKSVETLSSQGLSDSKPFIMSPFLSGARVEPGNPLPWGTLGSEGSDKAADGLFTSGSWSYEAFYKFEGQQSVHATTQSLARLHTTGSWQYNDGGQFITANLVGFAENKNAGVTGSLALYISPDHGWNSDKLLLTGANIFDGNQWHVSFGCDRPDGIVSTVSSSYFLRATRQNFGSIVEAHRANMYHSPLNPLATLDRHVSSILNASGSFIVIGSQSLATHANAHGLMNSNTTYGHDPSTEEGRLPMTTHFDGRVGHIRFWSTALTEKQELEHTLNFKSLGVFDPLTNFNFVTRESGSFERLRLDVSTDQLVTQSNALGGIELFDFTQQFVSGARGPDNVGSSAPWLLPSSHDKVYFHMSGSGFEPAKQVIRPERFDYSILDPKFDEASIDNKIRIRGFTHYENILALGGEVTPVYEVRRSEEPVDDTRFSIDISSVQALNEDMVNIFSTIDALDNVLGNPELLFSTEYPDLRNLREVYFNRLTDKIRLGPFFDFFKWFDVAVGSIIEGLVPRKTKFLGVNFVIESHMLERAKLSYTYSDIYLGENDRRGLHGQILLQQLIAYIRKI